jgi:hypothetical protein
MNRRNRRGKIFRVPERFDGANELAVEGDGVTAVGRAMGKVVDSTVERDGGKTASQGKRERKLRK